MPRSNKNNESDQSLLNLGDPFETDHSETTNKPKGDLDFEKDFAELLSPKSQFNSGAEMKGESDEVQDVSQEDSAFRLFKSASSPIDQTSGLEGQSGWYTGGFQPKEASSPVAEVSASVTNDEQSGGWDSLSPPQSPTVGAASEDRDDKAHSKIDQLRVAAGKPDMQQGDGQVAISPKGTDKDVAAHEVALSPESKLNVSEANIKQGDLGSQSAPSSPTASSAKAVKGRSLSEDLSIEMSELRLQQGNELDDSPVVEVSAIVTNDEQIVGLELVSSSPTDAAVDESSKDESHVEADLLAGARSESDMQQGDKLDDSPEATDKDGSQQESVPSSVVTVKADVEQLKLGGQEVDQSVTAGAAGEAKTNEFQVLADSPAGADGASSLQKVDELDVSPKATDKDGVKNEVASSPESKLNVSEANIKQGDLGSQSPSKASPTDDAVGEDRDDKAHSKIDQLRVAAGKPDMQQGDGQVDVSPEATDKDGSQQESVPSSVVTVKADVEQLKLGGQEVDQSVTAGAAGEAKTNEFQVLADSPAGADGASSLQKVDELDDSPEATDKDVAAHEVASSPESKLNVSVTNDEQSGGLHSLSPPQSPTVSAASEDKDDKAPSEFDETGNDDGMNRDGVKVNQSIEQTKQGVEMHDGKKSYADTSKLLGGTAPEFNYHKTYTPGETFYTETQQLADAGSKKSDQGQSTIDESHEAESGKADTDPSENNFSYKWTVGLTLVLPVIGATAGYALPGYFAALPSPIFVLAGIGLCVAIPIGLLLDNWLGQSNLEISKSEPNDATSGSDLTGKDGAPTSVGTLIPSAVTPATADDKGAAPENFVPSSTS